MAKASMLSQSVHFMNPKADGRQYIYIINLVSVNLNVPWNVCMPAFSHVVCPGTACIPFAVYIDLVHKYMLPSITKKVPALRSSWSIKDTIVTIQRHNMLIFCQNYVLSYPSMVEKQKNLSDRPKFLNDNRVHCPATPSPPYSRVSRCMIY